MVLSAETCNHSSRSKCKSNSLSREECFIYNVHDNKGNRTSIAKQRLESTERESRDASTKLS
jgi:hypothetical protein